MEKFDIIQDIAEAMYTLAWLAQPAPENRPLLKGLWNCWSFPISANSMNVNGRMMKCPKAVPAGPS